VPFRCRSECVTGYPLVRRLRRLRHQSRNDAPLRFMRRVLNHHYVRVYSRSTRRADVYRKCARRRLGSI
jgi:hypothetical protein